MIEFGVQSLSFQIRVALSLVLLSVAASLVATRDGDTAAAAAASATVVVVVVQQQ